MKKSPCTDRHFHLFSSTFVPRLVFILLSDTTLLFFAVPPASWRWFDKRLKKGGHRLTAVFQSLILYWHWTKCQCPLLSLPFSISPSSSDYELNDIQPWEQEAVTAEALKRGDSEHKAEVWASRVEQAAGLEPGKPLPLWPRRRAVYYQQTAAHWAWNEGPLGRWVLAAGGRHGGGMPMRFHLLLWHSGALQRAQALQVLSLVVRLSAPHPDH